MHDERVCSSITHFFFHAQLTHPLTLPSTEPDKVSGFFTKMLATHVSAMPACLIACQSLRHWF
jgi:hypothetical protein